MNVVKPRNSRSTYIFTIDVTDRRRMISHTIFSFLISKSRKFSLAAQQPRHPMPWMPYTNFKSALYSGIIYKVPV